MRLVFRDMFGSLVLRCGRVIEYICSELRACSMVLVYIFFFSVEFSWIRDCYYSLCDYVFMLAVLLYHSELLLVEIPQISLSLPKQQHIHQLPYLAISHVPHNQSANYSIHRKRITQDKRKTAFGSVRVRKARVA